MQVVNKEGHAAAPNELGTIVVKLPLPPGSLTTLFKAPERFKKAYLSDFPGFYLTGSFSVLLALILLQFIPL